MRKVFFAVLFAMFASGVSFAQTVKTEPVMNIKNENGGFIAVGYVHNAFAVRFALSDLLSLEGSFGFRSGDGDDSVTAGGRALYVLKKYNDFNIYGFGGVNLGYYDPETGDSSVIFSPSAGTGVEYFVVRNLSVSAEIGIEANFQKDWNFVATRSNWLSIFGFRYYLD